MGLKIGMYMLCPQAGTMSSQALRNALQLSAIDSSAPSGAEQFDRHWWYAILDILQFHTAIENGNKFYLHGFVPSKNTVLGSSCPDCSLMPLHDQKCVYCSSRMTTIWQ